jgi:DNA-binding PadR family transcriptional regulator
MLFRRNFQLIVLDALEGFTDGCFASELKGVISKSDKEQESSLGAVVMSLNRLEDKGLVGFTIDDSEAARGGKARRRYFITLKGKHALVSHLKSFKSLKRILPELGLPA